LAFAQGVLKIPNNCSINLATFDSVRSQINPGNYTYAGEQVFNTDGDQPITIHGTVIWESGEYAARVELPPVILFD
jgi:hypothetical protein